ncbi:hypothetical protein [Streptomyces sp. NPDC006552]|uniref:hypothetical protein n=1 Tax=Streptomyces sp. NPDC006552 TaxID=3157179 RepID=UPI0033BAF69C
MPIHQALFSNDEIAELNSASIVLARECMRDFGVSLPEPPERTQIGPVNRMERRYGLADEKMAREHGYHLGSRDPRTAKKEKWGLSRDQRLILTGTSSSNGKQAPKVTEFNGREIPSGGCWKVGERRLTPKGMTFGESSKIRELDRKGFMESEKDPQVQAAFSTWASCMTSKGYSYPNPYAPAADSKFQGNIENKAEIKVAVADVNCKKRVNLVGVWYGVERSKQQSLIKMNSAEVQAAKKQKESQLADARRVIKQKD